MPKLPVLKKFEKGHTKNANTCKLCDRSRGGTNCPVFANCSVFCDVREVRSSVLGKKVMFGGVRSSVLMFGELSEHLG